MVRSTWLSDALQTIFANGIKSSGCTSQSEDSHTMSIHCAFDPFSFSTGHSAWHINGTDYNYMALVDYNGHYASCVKDGQFVCLAFKATRTNSAPFFPSLSREEKRSWVFTREKEWVLTFASVITTDRRYWLHPGRVSSTTSAAVDNGWQLSSGPSHRILVRFVSVM